MQSPTLSGNVVITFEFVSEILKCGDSSEHFSDWTILSCEGFIVSLQDHSNDEVFGWNSKVWPLKWKQESNWMKATERYLKNKVVVTSLIILWTKS